MASHRDYVRDSTGRKRINFDFTRNVALVGEKKGTDKIVCNHSNQTASKNCLW